MKQNLQIGVMGSGEDATEKQVELAYELGSLIAKEGWTVVSGGRKAGVMHAVNKGAKAEGGNTLGILPGKDKSNHLGQLLFFFYNIELLQELNRFLFREFFCFPVFDFPDDSIVIRRFGSRQYIDGQAFGVYDGGTIGPGAFVWPELKICR